MRRIAWVAVAAALVSLSSLLVLAALTLDADGTRVSAAPGRLLEAFRERGVREIGAVNLVSAIYLGYRVYDTLGETLVLVLTVTGAALVLGRDH